MEKPSNVIQFPSKGTPRPRDITNEDVSLGINMVKHNHINETLATIIPILFTNIEIAGFSLAEDDDDEDVNIKNGALIVESIRALLCKYHGIDHPFQELAENIFLESIDGGLTVAKKINMELDIDKEGSES